MTTVTTIDRSELKSEVIDNITKLHQANIDSADGFQYAADQLSNPQYAEQFRQYANERRAQATELSEVLELNGKTVDREGSWLAELHRCYTKFREAISSNDTHAVIAEAERGEDYIKEMYEEVLKDTPGSAVNDVLQRQYAQVKTVHDRVRDLRDSLK